MSFTPLEIEERKLEAEIMKNPDVIEKGLVVLDHQVPAGREKIDIIALDSGNVMTIIELKVNEDDGMLMQALEYYDWVSQNIDRLAERYQERNPKIEISTSVSPRIILIAPTFSDTLKTCSKYINRTVDLFDFMYLTSKTGEKGLLCRSIEVEPPAGPPTVPLEIDDHVNYITNTTMKKLCKEVMDRIKGLGKDIEVKPTQSVLSFKYTGRVIAYILTRRNYFYISYPKRGNWYWQPINKKRDFTSEIMEGIKDFYHGLKGE